MSRTFIIAEAGVNHNGSLNLAMRLIDAAAAAGADAVKFQTFRAKHLIVPQAPKAGYQLKTTNAEESQMQMLEKLELGREAHRKLFGRCRAAGIEFLSTPFDQESLDFLVKGMKLHRIKLSSGEITNAPLLVRAARSGVQIILSTGMSALDDIRTALGALAFGYMGDRRTPSISTFRRAYESGRGQRFLKEKVMLLHCTTEYPAPLSDVNLLAIETMRSAFDLPVGFSDHTQGVTAALSAAARGAALIEKHMTLDHKMPGPDHRASIEPGEMKKMVSLIRDVERILGSPRKYPSRSEVRNAEAIRKSLFAARRIHKGEVITEKHLSIKRPGTGLAPLLYWKLLGTKASRDYRKDDPLQL